ncbi:DUF488 domain-containing protein [Amphiplicatus metriothermophilus]|uniref:Uncharacterized conserved protein YeaO, DUF488 family n=1 Tax=Amphiplicatus metriothermophilus TaxID=1519374 RepID=A0A239PXS1_9PROT|nr:DUF488 family protein [Amphiplicatus metriothermophilus]MBB5519865.1 uncharacterized protein YeaO (DUF488 family) [Amphiplicatus metriothermophilus]SNT75084.1 Uncharacterized conserved protein YeaO, DUF488 family [Amphiplicatus metriothermophilus]
MSAARKEGGLGVKRVYDPPAAGDGFRVLVDRLWPRGLAKAQARIDLWAKALAPSHELRRKAHAEPGFPDEAKSWKAFEAAYRKELEAEDAAAEARRAQIDAIAARLKQGPVTLLHASKGAERNNAAALAEWLRKRIK